MKNFEKSIEARLDLIKSAQRRSSYSYLAAVIISSAFLIGIFNTVASWDRGFAFMDKFSGDEVTRQLQKDLLSYWISNRIIEVDLLGIKISASDFTILGGFGLMIISTWLLMSVKRENSTVGTFLIETQSNEKKLKETIYHFITSNQIFSTVNDNKPFKNLTQNMENKSRVSKWINRVDEALFFLPSSAILFSLTVDILSVFVLHSPLRANKNGPLIINLSNEDLALFLFIVFLGFVFFVWTLILNIRALKYELGTRNILSEYKETIQKVTIQ